jgi:hypothetical protein
LWVEFFNSDSPAKKFKGEGNNKARFQAKLADGVQTYGRGGRVVGSTFHQSKKPSLTTEPKFTLDYL